MSADFVALLELVRRSVPVLVLAQTHAFGIVDEYVRFLALKLSLDDTRTLPSALSPSLAVEQVWRTHILLPHEYSKTCGSLLIGNTASIAYRSDLRDEDRASSYRRTLALYEQRFGVSPNPAVWPPAQEEQSAAATAAVAMVSEPLSPVATPTALPPAGASARTTHEHQRSAATAAAAVASGGSTPLTSPSSPVPSVAAAQPYAVRDPPSPSARAKRARRTPAPSNITVLVGRRGDKKSLVVVVGDASVQMLREAIESQLGYKASQQILYFGLNRLDGDSPSTTLLTCFGISDNARIELAMFDKPRDSSPTLIT